MRLSGPEARAPSLMRVPGHALGLHDPLIVDREVEAGAAGELADELALQLLPRRLALLDVRLPGRLALGEFLFRNQDVGAPLADIDTHLVARLEQRQPAADSGFGRRVEDRRARRRAALPAVADAGQ